MLFETRWICGYQNIVLLILEVNIKTFLEANQEVISYCRKRFCCNEKLKLSWETCCHETGNIQLECKKKLRVRQQKCLMFSFFKCLFIREQQCIPNQYRLNRKFVFQAILSQDFVKPFPIFRASRSLSINFGHKLSSLWVVRVPQKLLVILGKFLFCLRQIFRNLRGTSPTQGTFSV